MKNLNTSQIAFVTNHVAGFKKLLAIGGSSQLINDLSEKAEKVCLIEMDMNEFNRFMGARNHDKVDIVSTTDIAKAAADFVVKYGKFDVVLVADTTIPGLAEALANSLQMEGSVLVFEGAIPSVDFVKESGLGEISIYKIDDHGTARKQILDKAAKSIKNRKPAIQKKAIVPAKKPQAPKKNIAVKKAVSKKK